VCFEYILYLFLCQGGVAEQGMSSQFLGPPSGMVPYVGMGVGGSMPGPAPIGGGWQPPFWGRPALGTSCLGSAMGEAYGPAMPPPPDFETGRGVVERSEKVCDEDVLKCF
jgi:hypothetical protein